MGAAAAGALPSAAPPTFVVATAALLISAPRVIGADVLLLLLLLLTFTGRDRDGETGCVKPSIAAGSPPFWPPPASLLATTLALALALALAPVLILLPILTPFVAEMIIGGFSSFDACDVFAVAVVAATSRPFAIAPIRPALAVVAALVLALAAAAPP